VTDSPEEGATSTTDRIGSDDATEVRFSIRALLVWMAVLAVVLSALGAFIRTFPPEARLRIAGYWGVLAVTLCVMIAYVAHRRYAAERKAGAVHFRLATHSYFFPRFPAWGRALGGIACLMVAPAFWIIGSYSLVKDRFNLFTALNPSSFGLFVATAGGISILWWRRVTLAENGVIWRKDFFPWSVCRRWYWDACYRDVAVIDAGGIPLALRVPEEARAEVAALLERQVRAKPRAAGETSGRNEP
jgi:hypothetical protein